MLKQKLITFNLKVKEKAENATDDKSQQDLLSFLRHGANGMIKMHAQEFLIILEEKKIKSKIDHMNEVAEIMDSELSSYQIDDNSGKLSIKLKDQVVIQEKLFDVGRFIEERLKISPDDEIFFLLLGYFSEPRNYEMAQFFETAVKISE